MKTLDTKKIRKSLKKQMDSERYEHTLGVTYTAVALAMCYDIDLKKAEIAGLLHDCAKCIENEKKLALCEKYHIQMNEVERRNPYLLHAKLGSFLAMKRYGINDRDIINAILNHTTGRPNMSQLEKIIFVADYIEPHRTQAPNLTALRKQAFQNIDLAMKGVLRDTLSYLESAETDIDPMTRKTFEFYQKEGTNNNDSIKGNDEARN